MSFQVFANLGADAQNRDNEASVALFLLSWSNAPLALTSPSHPSAP